ncbi:MAG: ribonuclease P protein component [Armatimonadota bacterium]|nr:ribonuclease P protein component [Armatimonadota bacterium]MDR7465896.1 ribonuclease P protein component [Armatimonadota bacterium]MDR7493961.1 ribonuclease P protein component [Armatimonadota bacterium]MDR7498411.1 ribonuclease P protein component [Armatimonadota bacterium]MDR7504172.1 ribonuclease P protein component [Armatimonadota bacterium]
MSSSVGEPRVGTASPSEGATFRRLTAPEHFRLAYREGARVTDGLLIVYARPNKLAVRRLGIVVPARVGSAVRRNRLKRRLREASRMAAALLPSGTDVVVVGRPPAGEAPFAALQDSVRALFNRAAGAR